MFFGAYSIFPGLLTLLLIVLASGLAFRTRSGLRRAVLDESASRNFMPQLEGLRGLMAAGVVLHHAVMFLLVWPRTGHWALPASRFYAGLAIIPVLIFFFLTGFLFWSKLLRQPKVQAGPFLLARLRRLGPAYGFAMALLFLWVAVLTRFHLRVPLVSLVGSCLKWLSFSLPGRPDINGLPVTELLIAGTPWTLTYEWKFYVLLLFLPWFAMKPHRCLYLVAISVGIFEALSWHNYAFFRHTGATAQFLFGDVLYLSGHMGWSFGMGILVASLRAVRPTIGSWISGKAVSLAAIVLLGASLLSHDKSYFNTLLSLETGLVFLAVAYGNTMFGLLDSRPVMTLGRFSYSLYLCHGLVLSAIFQGFRAAGKTLVLPTAVSWLLIALGCLVSVAVAVVCHEMVEAPFMNKGRRKPSGLPAVKQVSTLREA